MSKTAVVFWSGTGNTEKMAESIAQAAGADLFDADSFNASMVNDYSAIAFGCPSMGGEELEDSVFEPMFEACKASLSGKKIALFGSYGWGDGEWMRNWQADCEGIGAMLIAEPVICNEEPGSDDLASCESLGKLLGATD